MKRLLPVIRPVVLLGIGLTMAVLSATVSSIPPGTSSGQNDLLAAAQALQITPTTTPTEGISKIGSTDGIVLMGIVIVLIVIMPVLLRRKSFEK